MISPDLAETVKRLTREQLDALSDDELARHYAGRWAPVQGFTGGIPWSMHMRAYNVYAKLHSKQRALIDLDGRGCRGGFGTNELDTFIPGWRDELSEFKALQAKATSLESSLAEARKGARTAADGISPRVKCPVCGSYGPDDAYAAYCGDSNCPIKRAQHPTVPQETAEKAPAYRLRSQADDEDIA